MEKYIKETLDSIYEQIYFKKNDDWEILIGIDGCNETLKYVHSIMENYKNLRVFMMEENRGTYITTNTIMSI
jgi:glycosyltransferase involved in cell wall biosynthesis